jgi:hypothetical protein
MRIYIKPYISILLILFGLSFDTTGQSKADSNKIFLNSKGHLSLPLSYFTSVMTENQRYSYFGGCSGHGIEFYTDRATSPILAVFDGVVIGIFPVGNHSAIMTKFGDYFITYDEVAKSYVKKGDLVEAGQIIASLDSNLNHLGTGLGIIISDKNGKCFDPEKWFNWQGKTLSPVFGVLRDGMYSVEYDQPLVSRKKGTLKIEFNNYTLEWGQNDSENGKIRWITRTDFEFVSQDTSKPDPNSLAALILKSLGVPIIELQKARGDTTEFRTTYSGQLEITKNTGRLVKIN